MEGACALTARAALRTGTGLVTWNMPKKVRRDMEFPEVIGHDTASGLDGRSDILVVGPGLGTDEEADRLLDLALASGRPLVLDADALSRIASRALKVPSGSVLTPHPGEAGRLLGIGSAEIQRDRLGSAARLVERFRTTVVLKGAGTLVASPGEPTSLLDIATPALAVGGSGDVLAGVIAAFLAQGLTPVAAAHTAVWLHGTAGQNLGGLTADTGVLASEIADAIPATLGQLTSSG